MSTEFRSRIITESGDEYKWNADFRDVEKTCDAWAVEGFIVFEVQQLPRKDGDTRHRVRLTAMRQTSTGGLFSKATGRKFK